MRRTERSLGAALTQRGGGHWQRQGGSGNRRGGGQRKLTAFHDKDSPVTGLGDVSHAPAKSSAPRSLAHQRCTRTSADSSPAPSSFSLSCSASSRLVNGPTRTRNTARPF